MPFSKSREGATVFFIAAQSISERSSSNPSELVVIRSAGSLIIRSLRLRELGLEYTFAIPKGLTLLAQQPELLQRVRISAEGNKS
jgi:hypothetical protein